MVLGNQSKQKTCGCVTSKTEEAYLFKLVFQLHVREPGHASLSRQGFTVKITVTGLFLHRSPKHGPRVPHILWPFSAAKSTSSPRDMRKRGRRSGPPAENLSHGLDDSSRSPKLTGTPTAPRPGRVSSPGPPGAEQPAPQWGLLLDSRCERLPEASTAGCSPGSGNVLLWLRPLAPVRCHLQMSPLRMSWMCCTMRLMATAGTRAGSAAHPPSCHPPSPARRMLPSARRPPATEPQQADWCPLRLAWWHGLLLTDPRCDTSANKGLPVKQSSVFFFSLLY